MVMMITMQRMGNYASLLSLPMLSLSSLGGPPKSDSVPQAGGNKSMKLGTRFQKSLVTANNGQRPSIPSDTQWRISALSFAVA
jgi:hypothetical protein